MTDDELLLVVLLVERRLELGLEASSIYTRDEGKVGATPVRVSGFWTSVTTSDSP